MPKAYRVTLRNFDGEQAVWWCSDFDSVDGFLALRDARTVGSTTYDSAAFNLSRVSFWAVDRDEDS